MLEISPKEKGRQTDGDGTDNRLSQQVIGFKEMLEGIQEKQ